MARHSVSFWVVALTLGGCYDAAVTDPTVASAPKDAAASADTAAVAADSASGDTAQTPSVDGSKDPGGEVSAPSDTADDVPPHDPTDAASADVPTTTDTGPVSCGGDSTCGTWLCKSGKCAPCAQSAECAAGKQCLGGKCLAVIECQSDKACQDAQMVCALAAGKCVECLSGDDCAPTETCKGSVCLGAAPKCTSTKQCASGQICDKATLSCVQCAVNTDCAPEQTCIDTVCVPKVCSPGQSKCVGSTGKAICTANGTGWTQEACGAGQSCDKGGCTKWLCAPDKLVCMGSAVVKCSADGLSTAPVQDCEKLGKKCKDGACSGG